MYGFILVYGFYVILHGHLTPVEVSGGAIAASAFALLLVSYGNQGKKVLFTKDVLSLFESMGLVLFIFCFLGLGKTFFYNFLANRGGLFENKSIIGINPVT
jgi:multicomponent Na+:H+ antiporter subunit B